MKLIIDIPENMYKDIQSRDWKNGELVFSDEWKAIHNGIPLPKGHGRLIDADELLTSERPKGIADDVWKESHIYKLLSNVPTIIEADKEGE